MMGAKNLARLHLLMREPTDGVTMQDESLKQIYERHNRELRKVRSFVRSRRTKDEFDSGFFRNMRACISGQKLLWRYCLNPDVRNCIKTVCARG